MILVLPHLHSVMDNTIVNMLLLEKWKMPHSLCGLLMGKDHLLGLKSNSKDQFKFLKSNIEEELLLEKETKKLKSNSQMGMNTLLI